MLQTGRVEPSNKVAGRNGKGPSAGHRGGIVQFIQSYGVFLAFLVFCIVLSCLSDMFLTLDNIVSILAQLTELAMISIGFTFCVVAGEFDMSTGSICSLAGMLAAGVLAAGHGTLAAVIAALIAGTAVGLVNGAVVAYIGIPSLIGTLATSSLIRGVLYAYSKGMLIDIDRAAGAQFLNIGQGHVGIMPNPVVILIVVAIVGYLVLYKTKLGRYLHAIGGNPVAARFSGIPVARYKTIAFMISGFASALAGIIATARVAVGHPAQGAMFAMDAFAAVFIGLMGRKGKANIIGTLVGVAFIAVMNNGFTLLSTPFYYQHIGKGLIILLSVAASSTFASNRE